MLTMKKLLLRLFVLFFFLGLGKGVFAQCTPADSTSCPDPENNGQICPDTLKNGYLNQEYNQTVSILAPPQVLAQGLYVPVKYLHLVDVGNLPPGISWKSNDSTNNFYPHKYACVLFSGVCTDTGTYALKIKVDVYVDINGISVLLGHNVDSTSLSITVEEANGLDDKRSGHQAVKAWPNPFRDGFHLQFFSPSGRTVQVEIYTLLGQRVFKRDYPAVPGRNVLTVHARGLSDRLYLVKLTTGGKQYTTVITRAR